MPSEAEHPSNAVEMRHVAWVLGFSSLASVLGTWIAWSHVERLSGGRAEAISLLLDIYGLVGTAVGFYIAFRQIRNAKLASEAAEKAANAVKDSFSAFDLIREISLTSNGLSTAQIHLNVNDVEGAIRSYHSVQLSLVRLIEYKTALELEDKSELSAVLKNVDKAIKVFTTSDEKNIASPDIVRSTAFNQSMIVAIERVSARISRMR